MSGFLPELTQALLLEVALAAPERAVPAWYEFRAVRGEVGLTGIDPASSHLLAMISRRLETLAHDGWEVPKIKGVHRKSLTKNLMLEHRVKPELERLRAAGVDFVVAGPMGLLRRVFPDPGARYVSAFDVLVKPGDAARAVTALTASGAFRARSPEDPARRAAIVDFSVLESDDELELVVHTAFLPESFTAGGDDAPVWARTVTGPAGGLADARLLGPEDALVYAAVHGAVWTVHGFVDWALDLAGLVRTYAIDWDLVVSEAARYHVGIPLGATLGVLLSRGVEVPTEVLRRLVALPKSAAERDYFEVKFRRPPLDLATLWADWRFRVAPGKGPLAAALGFPAFVEERLGLPGPRATAGLFLGALKAQVTPERPAGR